MTFWKDTNNKVHDDMNGEALYLPSWSQGMTQITQAEADAILAPPPPTSEQLFKQAEIAVQSMLDEFAGTWGYDSLLTASSYVTSAVPAFALEAASLVKWRDEVWTACHITMDAITGGTQAMPASVSDFVASLPKPPARPI
jgi:hypothetical protein